MSSNKPFPSSDLDVFKENSLILDNFVNSQENEHPDRFARKRPTITGIIREAFNVRTDISNMNETLIGQSRWDVVPKNTSLSLGGDNGALNKQAQALFNRTEMLKVHSREALKIVYLSDGANLVPGSFEQGGTLNYLTDILLEEKTGKCYSWTGSFPKVVTKGTLPTSEVEFVEKLISFDSGMVNVKSFGAVGDGLTDDWDAITKARETALVTGKVLYFPSGKYYTTKTLNLGGVFVYSQVPGKTDPYYGKMPNGLNFITGDASSNWDYYYNKEGGMSKTWRDHLLTVTYGTIIASDVASPIITTDPDKRFNISGIGVVGNHRLIGQDGISFPKNNYSYRGNRHSFTNISVTGCGNHGLALYSGWETSDITNSNFFANNGAGIFTGILTNESGVIQDSATEYLHLSNINASHNRLGGILHSSVRKHVSYRNISGNNNGQYDSPDQTSGKIDPLLGYNRTIPSSRSQMVALIEVLDGTVDTVGQTGTLINLTFDGIWGEQIAVLIKIQCNTNQGVITNVTVNNCTATRLRQITSTLYEDGNGALLYIKCKYLSGLQWVNNYPQSLRPVDVENVNDFGNSGLMEGYQPKTAKEYSLTRTKINGAYRANTLLADKPYLYKDFPSLNTDGNIVATVVKEFHLFYPTVNLLAPVSKWRIYAQHQSTNGDNWGIFELYVFRDNKGKWKSVVKEIFNFGSFTSAPTLSQDGVLTIPLAAFSMCRVELLDEKGWIGF